MIRMSRLAAVLCSLTLLAACSQPLGAPMAAGVHQVASAVQGAVPTTGQGGDATAAVVRATARQHATERVGSATRTTRATRASGLRAALTDRSPQPACGRGGTPPTSYTHVIWIWLENRSFGSVIGPPGSAAQRSAPYLNALADSCGLATNYHNVSHPSQPNYFAAVAGTTAGVTTNCEPSSCFLGNRPTIFSQVTSSGRQWRSYEQSMAHPCLTGNQGPYVDRHNPEVYFSSDHQQCLHWDVPMGDPVHGALAQALATDSLPAFSFLTPDVCSDMHSCSTMTGDRWLATWLPRIIASPGYQAGDTAVFVTFDEGEGGHTYRCASNTSDVGCHVATVVVAPTTPVGTRSSELFNHYSLLRTTEQLLGLPLLGHAADAGTRSMASAFGL